MAGTIFALSSGPGPSGVAVFRISGPGAASALVALSGRGPGPARRAELRRLRNPADGGLIDEALVIFFPGPASFTGEDIVELHTHGSLAVIRGLSAALLRLEGMAAAEAGAFTERALRNGKLDLIGVEALGDLLAAETLEQARFTQTAQRGLRQAAEDWRDAMLGALALCEAGIDFSDEADVSAHIDSQMKQSVASLLASLREARDGFRVAERVRRGFRISLVGPPNAGKSSLLNALARRDVAIVSPLAGTTRDVVEVHLDLDGVAVIVSDTAGIRASDDVIEVEGIARAMRSAETADLVLWLAPEGEGPTCPFSDALVIGSKADRVSPAMRGTIRFVSATTGEGLDDLVAEIRQRAVGGGEKVEGVIVAQERQAREVEAAIGELEKVGCYAAEEAELAAEDLRQALHHLDRLTGRIDQEEILGAIFSRFCIGK